MRPEDVPPDLVEARRASYRKEAEAIGKPATVVEKIAEGKLEKFYDEVCLLRQPYIKDDKVRVGDLITQAINKLGENVVVRRFVRYELGEQ
jgi:elongation factor Ts